MKDVIKATRHCPYCHVPDAIQQLVTFHLPARAAFIERSAHLQQCQKCQQLFMSVFEAMPTEQWNSYHYYLPQTLQQDLLISATLCTAPTDINCRCPMHTIISKIDYSQLQRLHGATAGKI